MRWAERSASTGSSAACPSSTFDRSTPAFAHTKPWRVSLMMRSPRRRSDAHRLRLDERAAGAEIGRVERHEPALGLRHDLLGDDEAVAVGERRVLRVAPPSTISSASTSPARTSGMPSTGMIGERGPRSSGDGGERVRARARPRRGRRASACRRRRRARPAPRPRRARAASPASITSVPQKSRVRAGDADARHLDARAGPSAGRPGPSPGAPAMIGLTPTTRSRRRREHVADAGHGEDRPDRDHRVARADEDGLGVPRARRARRARARRGRRRRSAPPTTGGSARSRTNHSCMRELRAPRRRAAHGDAGRDAVVGHRQQAGTRRPGARRSRR